jgi:hypothetical protein
MSLGSNNSMTIKVHFYVEVNAKVKNTITIAKGPVPHHTSIWECLPTVKLRKSVKLDSWRRPSGV